MKHLVLLASAVALFACNNATQPSSSSANETPAATPPAVTEEHDHNHGGGGMQQPIQEVKEGQEVFFSNLHDGSVVTNPVIVKFGVKGMEVEKAGEIHPDKGHHHLIIDGAPIPAGTTVPPTSETCIHYGKGQLADTLTMTPGKHTLTMQFANGVHTSFGEKMSKTIAIEVKK